MKQFYLIHDRTLIGVTTLGQSGPGSDGNEWVLPIPQSSSITETSPSDCLVSYQDTCWGWSYSSVKMQSVIFLQPQSTGPQDIHWRNLTPLQRCCRYILQPQSTGPQDTRWESLTLQQSVYCTASANWVTRYSQEESYSSAEM